MTNQELKKLNENLWSAATKMRADSDLKLNEIDTPLLGLIFLKFADNKYSLIESEIEAELKAQEDSRRQRPVHEIAIEKCGFYLPRKARYNYLLNLPEEEDIAKAIKEAMDEIESYKPELKDVLPQDEYFALSRIDSSLLKTLLKNFSDIPVTASGDIFGKIYEFFLGKFAMSEGQGGGEFYTPTSVVKYMVEVLEPYEGTVFDPACGSGGMFVQCSNFVDRRKNGQASGGEKNLFVYGAEKTLATVKLAKMNIVVNGLRGDIKQANAYYEDAHDSFGRFDYVMANPPFNVKDVNYDRIKDDKRFNTYGIPQNKSAKAKKTKDGDVNFVPNGNYLWINLFATSLKPNGKAALVMANSASDARHSERDIRETLVKKGLISQMVTMSSNMFSTVTLPASLWFFDKSKEVLDFETEKENIKILFIDARNVYRQVDRAHREFTQEQIWNLGVISRLYEGQENRFIELVDLYLKNVNDLLPNCLSSFQTVIDSYNTFFSSFKKWFESKEFSKEEALHDEFEGLLDFFTSEGLPKNHFVQQYERVFTALNTYFEKGLSTNKLQSEVELVLKDFEEEKRTVKKAIEKAFRALEKNYKIADKDFKEKDDKLWKKIENFRNLTTSLERFIEHTNERINSEPVFTEDTEGKSAIYFIKQIQWLQERFPEGKYEDVIGLCKVANYEEVKEQDFSLNTGRYVGVVIEEDGMTEEEFVEEMIRLNTELNVESVTSLELLSTINKNLDNLTDAYEV
ncbi:type I restriction-modification system subunit M [Aequorivita marisscotiae]|uniref:site-specific DNA-methyltransferase (adenine-specific) n=1 Tax=Aequorivita marisscotiae TaxID=3040348 RepID=A0ABY8KVG1_9FLAO|nr:type I restriction-modification system subunit M [Aequorivita sp. Ant34-E75]WGF91707.1 N-6 DNA methylase [Aequorivita sp. Ant34-E75]